MKRATFLFVLLCANWAFSSQYYVSTSGSDSNDGTISSPWMTVQKALDSMQPGDSAEVADGSYPEIARSIRSGFRDSRITIRGESHDAIIAGLSITNEFIVLDRISLSGTSVAANSSSLRVYVGGNNLIVTNCVFLTAPASVYQLYVRETQPRPTNCTVVGSRFVDNAYHAVHLWGEGHTVKDSWFSSTNGWDCFRVFSDNTIISGNTLTNWSNLTENGNHTDLFQSFTDHGLAFTSTNVSVTGNFAIDCLGCQIGNFTDDRNSNLVARWTFKNNIFKNVKAAFNINAPDFVIANNVFFECTTNTGHPIALNYYPGPTGRGTANGTVLKNNMFVRCGSNPASTSFGWFSGNNLQALTGLLIDYNLVVGTGAGTTKSSDWLTYGNASSLNGVDPSFASEYSGTPAGFALLESSQCIGSGTDLSTYFTDDFTGATRTAPWDIGAYELIHPTASAGTVTVGTMIIGP